MTKSIYTLWLTIFLIIVSIFIVLPELNVKVDQQVGPIPVNVDTTIGGYNLDIRAFGFRVFRELDFRQGLDLQGGVQAILEADMSNIEEGRQQEAIDTAKEVIEKRVNFLGVSEPNVYTSIDGESYRIIVELPGVEKPEDVFNVIGKTAQLEFREEIDVEQIEEYEEASELEPFIKTELTGQHLKRAQVVFEPNTGMPQVLITFNREGADLFEEITDRNVGKRLAIYLDGEVITAPFVQQAISGGEASISGQFGVDEANALSIQLNAGALPVPVSVVQQKTIGPTLGQVTVEKSIYAGLIGLSLVAMFMLINYGVLGIFSIISLLLYGLFTLAVYKFIPVTLTLSGITGFILSIGLAVDANILIFERIREELRAGKTKTAAFNLGFTRAWDSIRDANAATLMTVFVLFNPFDWGFLVTSGTVRGFALTLGIGVLIGLYTGVLVTKLLLQYLYVRERTSSKKK